MSKLARSRYAENPLRERLLQAEALASLKSLSLTATSERTEALPALGIEVDRVATRPGFWGGTDILVEAVNKSYNTYVSVGAIMTFYDKDGKICGVAFGDRASLLWPGMSWQFRLSLIYGEPTLEPGRYSLIFAAGEVRGP
jgi:hypothetical protein